VRELKPWDEDLLNAAALQTIVHGGQVFVVPQSKMEENRPMAAIMRYRYKPKGAPVVGLPTFCQGPIAAVYPPAAECD